MFMFYCKFFLGRLCLRLFPCGQPPSRPDPQEFLLDIESWATAAEETWYLTPTTLPLSLFFSPAITKTFLFFKTHLSRHAIGWLLAIQKLKYIYIFKWCPSCLIWMVNAFNNNVDFFHYSHDTQRQSLCVSYHNAFCHHWVSLDKGSVFWSMWALLSHLLKSLTVKPWWRLIASFFSQIILITICS